ncbi:MAG: rod shape-determining protein MreC [Spirochaetia bacterium]|nr:rod shape-determining protein MreC [Spirochaetia bacterium]
MLWDRIQQLSEILSLFFCIGFSIVSLFWNSNLVVVTVASSQKAVDVITSSVDSAGGIFSGLYQRFQSNEALRKERDSYAKLVDEYKVYSHDIKVLQNDNQSLRKELEFQPNINYPTIRAEVLSVRLNSIYRTIVINKGKSDKIYPFMPVISRAVNESGELIPAIVGKVIASNSSSAVVQPIINSNFNMGVQVEGGSLWAILSGNSGRGTYVILNFLDSGVIINPKLYSQIGPIVPDEHGLEKVGIAGREVYSSNGGGVFPAGLPIGIIVEEGPRAGSFKTAFVKPHVKFDELQFVTIIKKLPDKWVEDWPEEKNITIENPFYGELNFPGEEPEGKSTGKELKSTPVIVKPTDVNNRENIKKQIPPPTVKKPEIKKKIPIVDEEEEEMIRNIDGNQ